MPLLPSSWSERLPHTQTIARAIFLSLSGESAECSRCYKMWMHRTDFSQAGTKDPQGDDERDLDSFKLGHKDVDASMVSAFFVSASIGPITVLVTWRVVGCRHRTVNRSAIVTWMNKEIKEINVKLQIRTPLNSYLVIEKLVVREFLKIFLKRWANLNARPYLRYQHGGSM